MMRLHLIADDLTGALDTAAQFVAATGPIPVRWGRPSDASPGSSSGASVAIDSGTREVGRDEARATVAALAAALPRHPGALFYAKLDSLLRGHGGAEIAGWLAALAPAHCIIAPAFPFHGRITRGGVQRMRCPDGWRPTGTDLRADIEREGLAVRLCRPGEPIPPGVSLWDAESDADLAVIAAAGRALDAPVLWCGSGGLAGALADTGTGKATPTASGAASGIAHEIARRPVLGLFGTNHPVTEAQLAACAALAFRVPDGTAGSAALVARRLAEQGCALVGLALPDGIARGDAAERIARELGALARRLDPPGTLLVAGGETLRALCGALEAERLDLDGQVLPGVPHSILRGGRFDGVRVISKSGAFGDAGLLRRLLSLEAHAQQGELV